MLKSKSVFKRFVIAVGTIAIALGALTGCGAEKKADELSDKLVDVMVANEYVVDDFALIGTDVTKSGFDFDVNFNGVVSLKDDTKAFASVSYVVPSTEFSDLEKTSSVKSTYAVLNNIVDNYQMESCTISKVSDIVSFNNIMVKNTPPALDGYKTNKSLVYNLSEPTFDETTSTVSFDIKMLSEYKESSDSSVSMGYGVGFGSGGIGFGFGAFLTKDQKEGAFTTTDRYTLSLSAEEFEQVKQHPEWAYDLCADAIVHRDTDQFKAERLSANIATYDNANLLNEFDMEDTVNEM